LQRLGRTNRAFFRISAMDKRSRRDGRFIEQIGWYDPVAADVSKQIGLNEERAKYWVSVGAQPSPTVRDILVKRNLMPKEPWEAERARQREVVKKNLEKAAAAPAEKKEGEAKPEAKAEAKPEKKAEEKKEG
jgi:small subunit ribosomal protein S16